MYKYADENVKETVGLSESAINSIIETEHASRHLVDIGVAVIDVLDFDYWLCEEVLHIDYKEELMKVMLELSDTLEGALDVIANAYKVNRNDKKEITSCVRFFMSCYISGLVGYNDGKTDKPMTAQEALIFASE